MRRLLAICLLSLLGACETQGYGQRCEEARNCSATATCVIYMNPTQTCTGQNCVCCPLSESERASVPECSGGLVGLDASFDTGTNDAGSTEAGTSDVLEASTSDASEAGDVHEVDTGTGEAGACSPACATGEVCDPVSHSCKRTLGQACTSSAQCDQDLFCDGTTCRLQRGIGQNCSDATNCQSGYCVTSVCCNAACTGAGYTCNNTASPGVCTPPAGTDAGADVATD